VRLLLCRLNEDFDIEQNCPEGEKLATYILSSPHVSFNSQPCLHDPDRNEGLLAVLAGLLHRLPISFRPADFECDVTPTILDVLARQGT
jgi:hypothetical protein